MVDFSYKEKDTGKCTVVFFFLEFLAGCSVSIFVCFFVVIPLFKIAYEWIMDWHSFLAPRRNDRTMGTVNCC